MSAGSIVEHLDVVEHVPPGILSGFVCSAPDALTLEQVEEAFGNRVIVAVPTSAHAVLEIVVLEKRCPIRAGEL